MILRTIKCDVCGLTEEETEPGIGWSQWGALHGVALDGVANPSLCPEHKRMAAQFIDELKQKLKEV